MKTRIATIFAALLFVIACGDNGIDKKGVNNGANNGPNNGVNNGGNNGSNNGVNNGVNNGSNNGVNNGANNGTNNGVGHCFRGAPSPLVFGIVNVGQTSTASLTVENCSPDSSFDITRTTATTGFLVSTPDQSTIEPLQATFIDVTFAPTEVGEQEGTITIETTAGVLTVPVNGTAADVSCPVADAGVRRTASGEPFGPSATAQAGTSVDLSGAGSFSDSGAIARYEWTITGRPQGSTATLLPSATVVNPTLLLDLPGTYAVQLNVYDSNDVPSCSADTVAITALQDGSESEVFLQLTWSTDQNDLDLHYLHPNATMWTDLTWDCHYANKSPEWGAAGAQDNPSVDIDDLNGFGPENINHSGLESVIYEVGTYFYGANGGAATSTATTRVYVEGNLVMEDVVMLQENQFRHVAGINGSTQAVIPRQTTTVDFPPL